MHCVTCPDATTCVAAGGAETSPSNELPSTLTVRGDAGATWRASTVRAGPSTRDAAPVT